MEPETRPEQQPWPEPGQSASQQTAQQLEPGVEADPESREHMPPVSTFEPPASTFEPPASAFQPPAGPPMAGPPDAMPGMPAMAAAPLIGVGDVTGLQMKHRGPVAVWLLSFITFGIYGLVYWYKIHAELARFGPRQKISPVFELMSIWLLSFTIVLPIMSITGLGGKIRSAQAAAGLPADCSGGLGLLFAFLAGTHVIYYQSKLNQVVAVNGGVPEGQPVTLAG
jgi:hypothetical protein